MGGQRFDEETFDGRFAEMFHERVWSGSKKSGLDERFDERFEERLEEQFDKGLKPRARVSGTSCPDPTEKQVAPPRSGANSSKSAPACLWTHW